MEKTKRPVLTLREILDGVTWEVGNRFMIYEKEEQRQRGKFKTGNVLLINDAQSSFIFNQSEKDGCGIRNKEIY